MRPSFIDTVLLSCAIVVAVALATKDALGEEVRELKVYASPGGVSWHAGESRREGKWNESHKGFALAYVLDDTHATVGGGYRNSFGQWSNFVAYRWTPLHVEGFRFGLLAGLATGYHDVTSSGLVPLLAPAAVRTVGPLEFSAAVFISRSPGAFATAGLRFW